MYAPLARDEQCHTGHAGSTYRAHTLRVPLDGVDLVAVALQRLLRLRQAQAAHIDQLVRAASRKGRVVPPVHIQGGRCASGDTMERTPQLVACRVASSLSALSHLCGSRP